MALIAACQLLAVLEVVVPVGCCDKLRVVLVDLHVQPGEALIEAALHATRDGVCTAIGLHVGLRQRVLVAEGEHGAQAQRGLGVGIYERVAYHELCALVYPQQLLLQYGTTHAIGDRRCGCVLKVGDILVSARLVHPLEAVQCEVEGLLMLDEGLIERREQNVCAVTLVDGCYHQTVVLARVAAHNGGTHVAATTIRGQHLTVE